MVALDNRPEMTLARQLAAVQDWWRDAGVEYLFCDEVHPWLTKADEAEAPGAAAASPATRPEPAEKAAAPAPPALPDLPHDLAAFRAWWRDPASPLPAGSGPRIAARGEAGARLMLIVPMPEAQDGERLLSGPQGMLVAAILRALGLAPEQAYFASALPAHMALPDWPRLAGEGVDRMLRHHVSLVRPQRVVAFGSALADLLGIAPTDRAASLALAEGEAPVLCTHAPEHLLVHARQRARLWSRLLDWMPAP